MQTRYRSGAVCPFFFLFVIWLLFEYMAIKFKNVSISINLNGTFRPQDKICFCLRRHIDTNERNGNRQTHVIIVVTDIIINFLRNHNKRLLH